MTDDSLGANDSEARSQVTLSPIEALFRSHLKETLASNELLYRV